MFDLLWRTLWKNKVGLSRGERLRKERHKSSRPQLEALEDRMMPTLWPGMVPPPVAAPTPPPAQSTAPQPFSNLQSVMDPNHMVVMVRGNAATTLNLDQVFAAQSGLQYQDGLQWSMLGNTNAALVTPDLSEAELTLQVNPGQWGLATITVGATDADGVSEQESIVVAVEP
ncbi:MAG TPA: hypothetical protein VH682_00985 [Gemmataceae bacterium]